MSEREQNRVDSPSHVPCGWYATYETVISSGHQLNKTQKESHFNIPSHSPAGPMGLSMETWESHEVVKVVSRRSFSQQLQTHSHFTHEDTEAFNK